jgi:hypothetical protein
LWRLIKIWLYRCYDHLPQSMGYYYITRKLSAQSNKWLLFYDILVSLWQVKISMKLKLSCYNMHEEGEAVIHKIRDWIVLCTLSHNHIYMFLPLRMPYIPLTREVKNRISLCVNHITDMKWEKENNSKYCLLLFPTI